jgi:hypothetical protein
VTSGDKGCPTDCPDATDIQAPKKTAVNRQDRNEKSLLEIAPDPSLLGLSFAFFMTSPPFFPRTLCGSFVKKPIFSCLIKWPMA